MKLSIAFILYTLILSIECVGQVPSFLPSGNLEGYYSFSQSSPMDESGNGNDGLAVLADQHPNPEQYNNSSGFYDLESGGYINFGDVNSFEGTNELTISLALYSEITDYGGDQPENYRPILSKWSSNLDYANSSYRVFLDGERVVFEVSNGSTSDSVSYDVYSSFASTQYWSILTITFNDGLVKIYDLDDEQVQKQLSISTINDSNADFKIGDWYHSNDGFYKTLDGFVDELCVYSRELNQCEVPLLHLDGFNYPLTNGFNTSGQYLYASVFTAKPMVSTDSWQWFDCNLNQTIIGETGPTYYPSNDGNYACIVTYNSGQCYDTTDCFTITDLGMEDLSPSKDQHVYPNPIRPGDAVNFSSLFDYLIVYDFSGEVVHEGTTPPRIFKPGMYIIKGYTNETVTFQEKLIVLR